MKAFQCVYMKLSLILIMAVLMLLPVKLLSAQTVKQDFIFSGNPKMEPIWTAGTIITTIDGDLTIQNFDQKTLDSTNFAPLGQLKDVTGTVTVKDLSAQEFNYLPNLKEIGGDLIMHNSPDLEGVRFLKNSMTVNGSIEGKNCPKLCTAYSYLVSVDMKYMDLFDTDCFTITEDVDILSLNATIGDKRIINGSLICNLASNPNFQKIDSKLADSLLNVISVRSLLLDNCPITSLSSTLPSLKKVESRVEIINCSKLEEKKFSDWLYKIETKHSNMVLNNNMNVCLERKHVDVWELNKATIRNQPVCRELAGDADLGNASTLTSGTVRVNGKIRCVDVNVTNFSLVAMNFLMNIKIVETIEFIRCKPFINFKQIFPNGFPKADNVVVSSCLNFETDLDVLQIVRGKAEGIKIVNNPKVCFTEIQLQTIFNKSTINQTNFCGETCSGGIVAYRNGMMKSNVNLTEDCDQIKGELIFEGELPPKDEASLFANIRFIEGSLFFHRIKNDPITNRTFELLPNLQKIEYKAEETSATYIKYGCAVIILDVKEIDHFDMKRLKTINCGTTANCICIEGSPEYEKAILNSDDWVAVRSNQTTVAFFPINIVKKCGKIDYEKHIPSMIIILVLVLLLNPIIVYFVISLCNDNTIKASREKGRDKGEGEEKVGSTEKAQDKTKEEKKPAEKSFEPSVEEYVEDYIKRNKKVERGSAAR